ncbi:TonB-dependent receptor [Alteriqipengyuania lutimaris]|nr:TonB-dependent receptor [Alteriqipengyuania lutimaris]MBB3033608.1 TonB-dependent receptor [Alteriqipengyuania lutimaris]
MYRSLTTSLLAIGAATISTAAYAQVAPETTYSFDLPAQPMGDALTSVAERTGTNVVYNGQDVAGRRAPAIRGTFTAQTAFERILAGSGLTLMRTSSGAFVVSSAAQGSATSGRSAISGSVTGANSGRGLEGALVRIVETGQTTAVDSFGDFRFANVPAGDYTLEISFLGYETVNQSISVGSEKARNLAIVLAQPQSEGYEILVYGSRSARANALNVQRTAENSSDVISADDLGNFTGTTFAEALRRAPGVAFQRNSVTGDGTNVIVRGLEPDMNAVKLNGLNLPVGNGTGRSADLSNLLADSVGQITIHKSLLPSQDSSGTGGLIEIETLSPLDRPRRYASLLVEGGFTPDDFADDFLTSGTVSGTFGDNFGLSASVQYRQNSNRSIGYNAGSNGGRLAFGTALPLNANGQPITAPEAVDPLAIFPFVPGDDRVFPSGVNTTFYNNENETFAGTLSAEWQVSDGTNLKFDYQHSQSNSTFFSLTDTFTTLAEYVVPAGGGEAQLILPLDPGNEAIQRTQSYSYDPDVKQITDTFSFKGRTEAGRFTINYLAGYARGTESHPRQFGVQLRMPEADATADLFAPGAIDPVTGRILTGFGPRSGEGIPLPLLSDAGRALINDPSGFTIDNASGQFDDFSGSNDRYTASGSVRWTPGEGFLNYLEAGVFYENTSFTSNLVRSQIGGNVPVTSLGLEFVPSDLSRIGIDDAGFLVLSEDSVRDLADNLESYLSTTGLTINPIVPNPDQENEKTEEENLAAYVQARVDIGKLEIVGGVRFNRTKLAATNLVFPVYTGPILPENGGGIGNDLIFQNEFTRLVTEEAVAEDFLPRVLFNYRASDDLIFRGGYFLSVARPSIGQLSSETRIAFINFPIPGPEGVKPILQINSGNPNLKPAKTDNFDISAEYYSGIGIFKLSGFYKRIDNLLQTNITNGPAVLDAITLPDYPYFNGPPYFDPANPNSVFITGGTPVNSDDVAELWGVEAQAERRFDFLPGIWGGFGVYLNYTYTQSSRTDRYTYAYEPAPDIVYEFTGLPFVEQPQHSGTAALTYAKYDIDANLTYGYQSRALALFRPRGLSDYSEAAETLDFRIAYYLRPDFANLRIFFEANDLLNGTGDPDVAYSFGGEMGVPRYYNRATYLGGRRFKLGVSVTF